MFKYISQVGQDMWVIEHVFKHKRNGYFIDLAANDGVTISNTFLLEDKLDWDGVCVEPNPFYFESLEINRQCSLSNDVVGAESGEIIDFRIDNGLLGGIVADDTDNKPDNTQANNTGSLRLSARTLEEILVENNAPKVIDYLSLDVEGSETRILKNFPFNQYTFLALTIERPTLELNEILFKNGYVFVMNCFFDTFYIHGSISNFLEILKEPFQQIIPFEKVDPPKWFHERIVENYGPGFTPTTPNPVPDNIDIAAYVRANHEK